jgi:hypothetical protein
MSNQVLSTSFVQDQRYAAKSNRFQPIQPSKIADILDSHGFDLVHLKTGRAKSEARRDFQTTIARYRSRDGFEIQGLGFDIIFKIPHLYGSLLGVLGLFRGTCANQLNVGTHFESVKIKHLGNPMDELNQLIPRLVSQRESLVSLVKSMQQYQMSPENIASLARDVASARLAGTENVIDVNFKDLLHVRRDSDQGADLFTVTNVIQENALRIGFKYQTRVTDENGLTIVRNNTTRSIGPETVRAIDLNASIWDSATKILTAA